MTDIEKTAAGLTPNMVKALTWWCHDGYVSSEVDDATRRGLVRRDLGSWASGGEVALSDLGFDVRKVLLAKAEAEEQAKTEALAAKAAAERKIRDEGYEAGQRQQFAACLVALNRAVYGCDTWPDRPWDSVWEHLLERVRKAFGQESVFYAQQAAAGGAERSDNRTGD